MKNTREADEQTDGGRGGGGGRENRSRRRRRWGKREQGGWGQRTGGQGGGEERTGEVGGGEKRTYLKLFDRKFREYERDGEIKLKRKGGVRS